jgi:hypothetical protein
MPLTNAPKVLRGAFIEYGLSIPPLFVVFQFNPVELTRSRTLTFGPQNSAAATQGQREASEQAVGMNGQTGCRTIREYHEHTDDLLEIRDGQRVTVQEETISFDIRLDATDQMNEGNAIAAGFGVLPQLATLELMVHPKADSLLGAAVDALLGLGDDEGFSSSKKPNPPLVLFIWGHKRVLPVNITSMNITETEFSTLLDPTRATVSVSLTVIEGGNPFFTYSKVAKEVSSVLNLANIADIANVVIPG